MHIPEYSQIVSLPYLVTCKKNDFFWGPEQQQAFAQIKQEIAHAVALGPVRTGPDVKNVLYSAAGDSGLSWSLWQKPGLVRLTMSFLFGSRSSKTFKPKKNIPEGSHQYELLKHAEATLGSGNLRQAVMLPDGEDLNEWIAVNSES
ncbi:hypothetical protein DUI87_32043 [Hirundo rustica rustica]|uniref:Reverse transcriptase/retrotransposon-derived protein RNase H-like domain-containing protein n=1 Tax=Hirundo rustica rustica TaxID=333673 RepID=A0A3M0IRK0_HIRRU|nr:hypothetical protein DUI87_32043 [Hirundo rustica rustica]